MYLLPVGSISQSHLSAQGVLHIPLLTITLLSVSSLIDKAIMLVTDSCVQDPQFTLQIRSGSKNSGPCIRATSRAICDCCGIL